MTCDNPECECETDNPRFCSKTCKRREFYLAHKDEETTYALKWAANNPGTQAESREQWRARNPEKARLSKKKTEAKNPLPKNCSSNGYVAPLTQVDSPLTIESDNILIVSDWHIPFVSEKWFARVMEIQKEHDVRDIAIPGDFLDCENWSTFKDQQPKECWEEEMEYAEHYGNILSDTFDNVYYCVGNHEFRWVRALYGKGTIKRLWKMIGIDQRNVHITENDYMVLNGDTRICHSKNYSQTELSIAKRLATKYHCNIANAHGHFAGIDTDISGNFWVCDLGGLFDSTKIKYMQNTSTYPVLENGFLHVLDGRPILHDNLRW